jgi:HEAT repeat protein
MNNTTWIIAAVGFLIAATAAVTALLLPAAEQPVEPERPKATASAKAPPRMSSGFGDDSLSSSTPKRVSSASETSAFPAPSVAVPTGKEATMSYIQDAMTTWSAEGVPALQPLLSSPDKEIRAEAIEAMKQLSVPEAVTALRQAANQTKDPAERQRLLDAAEWAALPSFFAPSGN